MVLLALRAVLQLLPVVVAVAELLVPQIALLFVLEIAKALAMVVVLVVVVTYAQVAQETVMEHVQVGARQLAADFVTDAVIHVIKIAQNVSEHAVMHVLQVVLLRANTVVLVNALLVLLAPVVPDVQIHALVAEGRVLIIALHVQVLVPDAPHVLGRVQDAMDVATNALPHVSNLAPDVLVVVHAERHVGQAVNLLAVIPVPALVVMGVLTHVEHAVLLVQQAVLQIAEQLARVPVMEA